MKNKLKTIKKFLLAGTLMIGALTVFGALPEAAARKGDPALRSEG